MYCIHTYVCIYIYIYTHICTYVLTDYKRELEYRIPRLCSPVNFRRFPDIFGDFLKTETILL